MPLGAYIRDANAVNLATGATLNAAGTTNGTIQTVPRVGKARVEVLIGTVTGTSPTLTIKVQSSSASDFSSDVVDLCTLDSSGGSQSNTALYADIYDVKRKYKRATVTLGGTSPVYTGTTIKIVPSNVGRDASATA